MVKRLEAHVANMQPDRDRNGFEAADRIHLDLTCTANASRHVLIIALSPNVNELKATGAKAAGDLRMEGVLRRGEVTNRIAGVKDLAVQVADMQTKLARLKRPNKLTWEVSARSLSGLSNSRYSSEHGN
jgi:hypothetical protein